MTDPSSPIPLAATATGRRSLRTVLIYIGLGAWFCGLLATFYFVWRYKMTPGPLAEAPITWPSGSRVRPAPGVANIVMIAHPQCPCTTASMNELSRLSEELHGAAKIHVVLVRPDDAPADFEEGAVAKRAATIPGVDIVIDEGGVEGDRFGAIVSGSTIVYGADGKLLFRGGLTTARGHEGRGPATDRIVALVQGRVTDRVEAPTFGCALKEHDLKDEHR